MNQSVSSFSRGDGFLNEVNSQGLNDSGSEKSAKGSIQGDDEGNGKRSNS
jgi:hypothetical protein